MSRQKQSVTQLEGVITVTKAPYRTPSPHSKSFGEYVKFVRTSIYKEALRPFALRVGLSPGYIGKVEQGLVGIPRRETITILATKLGIDPNLLLLKAGFTPDRAPGEDEYDFVTMRLRQVDPTFVPIVLDFVDTLIAKYPRKE